MGLHCVAGGKGGAPHLSKSEYNVQRQQDLFRQNIKLGISASLLTPPNRGHTEDLLTG